MNHTIKGIIIVVVITSMLVVGATSMISIMQNSFASKKHDFKKERDPNTNSNTNINTNSADSISSSTVTASNTNNINNSACTVTVNTCPKGSTPTSTPTPIGTPGPTTCNPSTVSGQPATPNDGTCTATLPPNSEIHVENFFIHACDAIPGSSFSGNNFEPPGLSCNFPSTPGAI